MRYIHQKPDWPTFKWNTEAVAEQLAPVRYRQGILVGRLGALVSGLRSEAGLETLTVDVVTTSAIEGETLPREAVRSSIARRLGLSDAGLVSSSREIDGLVSVLLDATKNYETPLTAERMFGWHAALFPTGYSGTHRITVADWRKDETGAMQVISGAMGAERVHFEAPAATRLPDEMKRFLDWFNNSSAVDPVLRAAIAHLWFVTIHPFDDGNGRLARAIADMALARADGTPTRFYSMSAQIVEEREEYYRRLEVTQRGGVDITGWIEWFLACLNRAFDRAEKTLARVLRNAIIWERANTVGLNERQHAVLSRMLGEWEGYLTSSKYAKLAGCSTDTALRDITQMIAGAILTPNEAGGRSTSYRLATDVSH